MAALSLRRFGVLLRGLSGDALFRDVMANAPVEVDGHEAHSAAISRM